jgi:molybdopterin-guanine dinucleotide biosynthesis protein A
MGAPVRTAGIVLAGGASTRFGRDKLAVPFRGAPLLHHAVRALSGVCDELLVVLAPGAPEPSLPAGVTVGFARDAEEGLGPLAGLRAGLAAAAAPLALVAGGDMPELAGPVLRELLRVAEEARVEAAVLADGEGWRPLPMAVRTRRGEEVARILLGDGERALRRFLQALRIAVVDEATWHRLDPARGTLLDVDEPEDLQTGR